MNGLPRIWLRRDGAKGCHRPQPSGGALSSEACGSVYAASGLVSLRPARSGSQGLGVRPVPAAQHAGFASCRYYDLAYVAIVLLAFPLYLVKAIDWRLCSSTHPEEMDPWLIQPPSPAWVKSWPCNGDQLSKLGYTQSSPSPLLRHLSWPFSYPAAVRHSSAELHFFTPLYTVFVGGLIMLSMMRGRSYGVANRWRLSWAFLARAQVRATPLLVKLLRPQTAWPVAISQSLALAAHANVPFSVALMGPWRHQALGALVNVFTVIVIVRLYGSSWPYTMLPKAMLLLHAACGLMAFSIPAFVGRCAATTATTAAATAAAAAGADAVVRVRVRGDLPKSPKEGAEVHTAHGLHCGPHNESRELLSLCRRLVHTKAGAAAAGDGGGGGGESAQPARPRRTSISNDIDTNRCSDAGAASPRNSSDESSCSCSSDHRRSSLATYNGQGAVGRSNGSNAGGGGESCGLLYDGYDRALAWEHVYMKIPGVEPGDLPEGISDRLTGAMAEACRGGRGGGAACTDIVIRSGCVEVHLDLVRRVAPPTAVGSGSAVGSVGWARGQAAPPQPPSPPKNVERIGLGVSSQRQQQQQLAPPSTEQQGLASCILQALGLPPGYDAAVRAQVGAHLLTLTPAAGSGGVWAVLGTRRVPAHEVPWVTKVEPPVIVGPAGAREATGAGTGAGGSAVAVAGDYMVVLRLTVSGSAERLLVAHEDAELEVLALFEGSFLRLSAVQWGPLEVSPCAAAVSGSGGGGGGGGDGGGSATGPRIVRLPPCLALSRRLLTVNLALPAGRAGAVSLLFMRRRTAGQNHPLLLLQPEDAAIATEVAAMQARAHAEAAPGVAAVDGPPASSVTNFIRDLGYWLQYRDFWRQKAAAEAAASAAARSPPGGRRLSASWMRALLAWSRRSGDVVVGGGAYRLLLKSQRHTSCGAGHQATTPGHPGAATAPSHGRGRSAAAAAAPAQSGNSDLLDQGHSGGGGGAIHDPFAAGANVAVAARNSYQAVTLASGHSQPPVRGINGGAAPSPLVEEQQRLAQGSLPAFGQREYGSHMQTARRVLLEFALEQRCAAVAAALLEPAPVPPLPLSQHVAATAAAAAAHGPAGYLVELAESSRAASPDGLTLLHRAVRSGDGATVEVVLRATGRAAEAAAAAADAAAAPSTLLQPESLRPDQPCREDGGAADRWRQLYRRQLYDWDTPDVHGITPLHYLAVLGDGGALARNVLGTHPEALTLWDVARGDMPSPASFAAQNGLVIDAKALRRAQPREECNVRGSGNGSAAGPAQTQGFRALFLAAVLGFHCGDVERQYQGFARAGTQGGALLKWRLLLLHVLACAAGLLQAFVQPDACCRRVMLPLVALHGGSFLLALYRPMVPHRWSTCRVATWAMQALALAVLLANTISLRTRARPTGCSETHLGASGDDDDVGSGITAAATFAAAAAADTSGKCGGAAFHHGLLALHHALAVASMPYMTPCMLHKVLAVQVVEVTACALLLLGCMRFRCAGFGATSASDGLPCRPLGSAVDGSAAGGANAGCGGVAAQHSSGAGPRLAWAGSAAAHVAGGSLLRSVLSFLLILAADLRTRAAFVRSQVYTSAPAPPPLVQQQQPQQQQQQHVKLD